MLSKMLPYKFIDLKGSICNVDVNVNFDDNAPKQDYLTIGWLYDNYKPFENMFSWKRLKCSIKRCIEVTFVNRDRIKFHYIVFSTYQSVSPFKPHISVPPKSWNQVVEMCKGLNASLPDFQSKDRISEFVALLKLVKRVPDMDAIPISLRYNYTNVGIKILSPYY